MGPGLCSQVCTGEPGTPQVHGTGLPGRCGGRARLNGTMPTGRGAVSRR